VQAIAPIDAGIAGKSHLWLDIHLGRVAPWWSPIRRAALSLQHCQINVSSRLVWRRACGKSRWWTEKNQQTACEDSI